jgi:hypothetical protein
VLPSLGDAGSDAAASPASLSVPVRPAEYASRLLSHAEVRLQLAAAAAVATPPSASVESSSGGSGGNGALGIDAAGGVPASWFSAPPTTAAATAAGAGAGEAYLSALRSTLGKCRVSGAAATGAAQAFAAAAPSARGRWIGGWVARYDAASGLHLVVFDSPASTQLAPAHAAAVDALLADAGAGVGVDAATGPEQAAGSAPLPASVAAMPPIVTREWVRLTDMPAVMLPLPSRLTHLPAPPALPLPRLLQNRKVEAGSVDRLPATLAADAHDALMQLASVGQATAASPSASLPLTCSVCCHTASATQPLLRCADGACTHAVHASCIDPWRAAESARAAVAGGASSAAASSTARGGRRFSAAAAAASPSATRGAQAESDPSSVVVASESASAATSSSAATATTTAQQLRLFPRSVRDDVFGWHVQVQQQQQHLQGQGRAAKAAAAVGGVQARLDLQRSHPTRDALHGQHVFTTAWRCAVCRQCDSCGSAHPGGPFAQQASAVSSKLLDAILLGRLSSRSGAGGSGVRVAGGTGSAAVIAQQLTLVPDNAATSVVPHSSRNSVVLLRPALPLWSRGGVTGPADVCPSDTAPCVRAAETLAAAFSTAAAGPSPSSDAASGSVSTAPAIAASLAVAVALDAAPPAIDAAAGSGAGADLGASAAGSGPASSPHSHTALTTAMRKYGFAPPASGSHFGRTVLVQPKGWSAPDIGACDRLTWGLHSFTPIPGTLQYNARRARALAAVSAAQQQQQSGSGGAAAAFSGADIVPPSEPVEQLLCTYCVERVSAGCFCPVCHCVYTDGDGYMAQVRANDREGDVSLFSR